MKKPAATVRRFIMSFAVVAIMLNFAFDYYSFNKQQLSDESGRYVVGTYELILKLRRIEALLPKPLRPGVTLSPSVDREIVQLQKLARDSKERSLFSQLSKARAADPQLLASTLNYVLAEVDQSLQSSLENDVAGDREAKKTLLAGLLVDGILLSILFMLFALEMREQRRVERNLTTSLNYLRETNFSLREEQLKRQMTIKTTVHDLKNPLSSIHGFAELIADELHSHRSVQEFSEIIRKISENSLKLVDSLLAAPSEQPPKMETVDLVGVIEDVCKQTEIQARTKKQSIICELGVQHGEVLGNRIKLEELVSNLVGNAVKYSPSSREIRVRLSDGRDVFKVEVEDQGPGFTPDDLTRAFQYGQKLSAKPTGDESSTGLGLFMAKQIVELHHGRIKIAEKTSGRKGACVAFELPKLKQYDVAPALH